MRFDGILLCSDLDGTLLNSERVVSRENKEAIAYFKQNGGRFTFVSGRLPYFMASVCEAVEPNAPIAGGNGCSIYDVASKRYLKTYPLPSTAFPLADAVLAAFPNVGIQTTTFKRIYFYNDNDDMRASRTFTGMPYVIRHYRDVTEPIAKILFCDTEKTIDRIERLLTEHPQASQFTLVRSEKNLYEILPHGINKGSALADIAQQLHIDLRQTVAIGDYYNDIPMIQQAGVGIAVANAVADAKTAADFVTVSNDEHAIAQVIARLGEGLF